MKAQLFLMYGGMDFNHVILYCCLAFFAGIGAAKLKKHFQERNEKQND